VPTGYVRVAPSGNVTVNSETVEAIAAFDIKKSPKNL
jgi:hypothetical protein